MKKLLISTLAFSALFAVSCQKEAETPVLPGTHTVTIIASFSEDTKTFYEGGTSFNWKAGDKIGVVAQSSQGSKVFSFSTTDNGATAKFTGEVEDGYELSGVATYPYTQAYDGYACNDFVYDPEKDSYRLWGSIKPDTENPLSSIPMMGLVGNSGAYNFKTATGMVKFTFENLPAETAYLYLEIPSSADGYLNGWFSMGSNGEITMANAVEGWKDRYNWNVPSVAGETVEYYFPIPVGTIPAGLKVEVCNASWSAIYTYTTTKDIEVPRNKIVNIAPIRIPDPEVFTLQDILGTYEMTASPSGYSSNNTPGNIVIAESDDTSKGNVMMTMFAGIAGKQYGTFNGSTIVFPADQLFADNPYDNAADYPYIALDAYTGGVTDCTFTVLGQGHIKYVGDALGFRATTNDLWFNDSHNGAWPWNLAFSSVEATWIDDTIQTLQLSADMLAVNVDAGSRDGLVQYDGKGKAALCDGDATTFWHTPWASSETIISWYGANGAYGTILANYTAADIYDYNDLDPVYGAYVDIDVSSVSMSYVQLRFQLRNVANDHAKHVVLYGSTDSVNWQQLAEVENVCSGVNPGEWINWIESTPGFEPKALRLSIISTTTGDADLRDPAQGACVHMAELDIRYR